MSWLEPTLDAVAHFTERPRDIGRPAGRKEAGRKRRYHRWYAKNGKKAGALLRKRKAAELRIYQAAWRDKNRERIRKYHREYAAARRAPITAEKRSDLAKRAANIRWGKR